VVSVTNIDRVALLTSLPGCISKEYILEHVQISNVNHIVVLPCRPGVGNLSLVAVQKQSLQGMTGRTNFPPTIPFHLLFMMLLKLGHTPDGSCQDLKNWNLLQSGQSLGIMTVAGKFSNVDAIFVGVRSCCLLPSHRNNLVEDQVCVVEKWAISSTP